MKIEMGKGAVPFVITYRKILERPKIVRTRRFVGPRQLFRNLVVKVIEAIENAAFETETVPESPGRSVAVHWAIGVEDPWDIQPGREATIVAFRHAGDVPPCGAHFEIIEPPDSAIDNDGNEVFRVDGAEEDLRRASLGRRDTSTQRRVRADRPGIRPNGKSAQPVPITPRGDDNFRRPAHDAYGIRSVRTLEEERLARLVDELADEQGERSPLYQSDDLEFDQEDLNDSGDTFDTFDEDNAEFYEGYDEFADDND